MGSKAGPAPDYAGAAQAQGASSERIALNQTHANRPNINTPFGGVSWSSTPEQFDQAGFDKAKQAEYQNRFGGMSAFDLANQDVNGWSTGWDAANRSKFTTPESWNMNMNLPPAMQAALEAQQRISQGRSQMGEQLLGQAGQSLSQGLDWDSLQSLGGGMEARNRAEDAIYNRATSRLDPQFQQRESDMRSRLYNQGLREGDAAFDREAANFGRERTDAYQAARDASIMGGGQEMSRQFQQDLTGRQQGISEGLQRQYGGMNALNAFLAGQQVSQPNMPGFMGASAGQAPNMLGAAQMQGQYGMDAAAMQNQLMGSLFGAGGQLGMAALL